MTREKKQFLPHEKNNRSLEIIVKFDQDTDGNVIIYFDLYVSYVEPTIKKMTTLLVNRSTNVVNRLFRMQYLLKLSC